MENRRKKMKASAITAAALLALTAQTVSAADAVGYNVVTVPANSDVLVSVPFNQKVEATFTVSSVNGAGITVNETLAASTYNSSYYVRFINGSGEGLWSTISANGYGGLTIANDLSGYIANGDQLNVYKHHNLSSLFPAGLKDHVWNESTKILLPANDVAGINKGYITVAYNTDEKKWKAGRTDYSNQKVVPGQGLIVRNESAEGLTWIAYGNVLRSKAGQILPTGGYDVAVAGFEVPVRLADLALEGEGQILLPANDSAGFNKGYTTVAYNDSEGKWKVGRTDYSNVVIPAGEGFIVRRDASHTTESVWAVNP